MSDLGLKIVITGDSRGLQVATNTATSTITQLASSANQASAATGHLASSEQQLANSANQASAATNHLASSEQQLASSANHTNNVFLTLNNTINNSATSAGGLSHSFGFLRSLLPTIGLAMLAKDILDTNREMESLRVRLESVTGSADKGTAAFKYLLQLAQDTPFEIADVTKAYLILKNSGLEPTAQTMESLTNQASKLGGKAEDLTALATQLGQAWAKSTLQMVDMKVIAEHGVPIFDMLGNVTGKNTAQLMDMSEKGLITKDVIAKLIVEMGRLSAGSNARAMETLNGKISILADSWHKFEDALLQDKSEGAIKSITTFISNQLDILTHKLSGLGQLAELQKKINTQFQKINLMKNEGSLGSLVDALAGQDITVEQNKLDILLKQRQVLIESIEAKKQAAALDAKNSAKAAEDKNKLDKEISKQMLDMEYQKSYGTPQQKMALELKDAKDKYASLGLAVPDEVIKAITDKFSKQIGKSLAGSLNEALAKAAKQHGFDLASVLSKFESAGSRYGVDPALLIAQAKRESSFNPKAVSPAGTVGFSQFMPGTAARFGLTDRTDPIASIEAQARYMGLLLKMFNGDVSKALAGYNAGEGNVKKYGGIPPFRETKSYVADILKLYGNDYITKQFESGQKLAQSQQQARVALANSAIDLKLKEVQQGSSATIEIFKQLKDAGELSITEYWRVLTSEQTKAATATIESVKAKLAETAKQRIEAMNQAAPEERPKIEAEFTVKTNELKQQLQQAQNELKGIESANLFSRDKELEELNKIIAGAKNKLAELNNSVEADPIVIKARVELENKSLLENLRANKQGKLADSFANALVASEQAVSYEAQIGKVQNRTQIEEQRIKLLQDSKAQSSLQTQQQLRELYAQSADEVQRLADKLQELGDNTGLDSFKLKALSAKNAAQQLRLTMPSLSQEFVNAGQNAAISSMAQGLVDVTSGAKSAGEAFRDMGLSIVKALQQIAAQKLAEQIIGGVINLAGMAFGATTGGGAVDGINPNNASIGNAFNNFIPAFASGGLITGAGNGSSDSITMPLPVGSFVLKEKSVKAFGLPALKQLIASSKDSQQPSLLAKVSNGEFFVPPDIVRQRGAAFFESLNNITTTPPASFAKYANGGMVGNASNISRNGEVSVAINNTINQQPSGTIPQPNLEAFNTRLKALVTTEIQNQQRPGGLLYGA